MLLKSRVGSCAATRCLNSYPGRSLMEKSLMCYAIVIKGLLGDDLWNSSGLPWTS